MALIETVTARLTADVADFQAGFRRAETSVQSLQRAVASATAAASSPLRGATMFGRGGFATGDRAARELMASMVRDAQNVAPAVSRVTTAVTGMGQAFRNTANLGRSLRTGMQVLATQAIGLPGPLGRVASALLVFGTGGMVTTAVLAGLAGIAIGFERAKKKVEGLVAELERVRQFRSTEQGAVLGADPKQLAALEARLKGLQEVQRAAAERLRPFQGRPQTGLLAVPPEIVQEFQDAVARGNQIRVLETQIAELRRLNAQAAAEEAAGYAELASKLQALKLVEDQIAREMQGRQVSLKPGEQLKTVADQITRETQGRKSMLKPEMLDLKGFGDDLNKELGLIGLNAMESLVRGFIQGTKDFKDILFNLMLDFALGSIVKGLQIALGWASPSKVAIEAGHAVGEGLMVGMRQTQAAVHAGALAMAPASALRMGPMTFRGSFDASGLPPAMSPFDAARDATWQRLLRESTLVARSQGFR